MRFLFFIFLMLSDIALAGNVHSFTTDHANNIYANMRNDEQLTVVKSGSFTPQFANDSCCQSNSWAIIGDWTYTVNGNVVTVAGNLTTNTRTAGNHQGKQMLPPLLPKWLTPNSINYAHGNCSGYSAGAGTKAFYVETVGADTQGKILISATSVAGTDPVLAGCVFNYILDYTK